MVSLSRTLLPKNKSVGKDLVPSEGMQIAGEGYARNLIQLCRSL